VFYKKQQKHVATSGVLNDFLFIALKHLLLIKPQKHGATGGVLNAP